MNKIEEIKKLIKVEKQALTVLEKSVNKEYSKAINLLKNCKGKIVVVGIGKSGHIGAKIAATFSSTGSPAIFIHGTEALHGDLGIVNKNDVVIIISNSGNSKELLELIPSFKRINIPVISITGNSKSSLAEKSDVIINIGKQKELDDYNLAPTSSSMVTLVVGDILATILSKEKKFKKEDFAVFHPCGSLGKRLSVKVSDLMHSGTKNATVKEDELVEKVISELTSKALGAVCVIDNSKKLIGVITDGDLRRAMKKHKDKVFEVKASQIMTKKPTTVLNEDMAFDALKLMEERKSQISVLPVLNKKNKLVGLIRLHDIVQAGI
jgi:arabinose-5-phosphate isomerase